MPWIYATATTVGTCVSQALHGRRPVGKTTSPIGSTITASAIAGQYALNVGPGRGLTLPWGRGLPACLLELVGGEESIMPNLPWDLLAGRLGRYLQLSYISAVLAGFCLVGEIVIRSLNGTPAQRRHRIATRFQASVVITEVSGSLRSSL